jgi:class 3 adenylate cyclase
MPPGLDEKIAQLKGTIAEMDAQRSVLGDDFVDATLDTLRSKLFELEIKYEQFSAEAAVPPTRQRKLVTLLYLDVVDSTAMTQHLDPEDTMEILDNALSRLAEPIAAHGGHVTRFTGDGFKAIFGDPLAREDDPEQAIRAGLEILEVSNHLAEGIKRNWGIQDFQVRIGIDTGLAALGGKTEVKTPSRERWSTWRCASRVQPLLVHCSSPTTPSVTCAACSTSTLSTRLPPRDFPSPSRSTGCGRQNPEPSGCKLVEWRVLKRAWWDANPSSSTCRTPC